MTEPAFAPTDQHCPHCSGEGVSELLHSNGARTLCTNPWCGYDVTEPEPGSQGALL